MIRGDRPLDPRRLAKIRQRAEARIEALNAQGERNEPVFPKDFAVPHDLLDLCDEVEDLRKRVTDLLAGLPQDRAPGVPEGTALPLVFCKACRGMGGLAQEEHALIERIEKLSDLDRYTDADAALTELRHKFPHSTEIPYLETCVHMINKGVMGAYYASGGILARAAKPPAFRFPEGFARRVFKPADPPVSAHMTLLDIADSKVLRVSKNLSSRQYENWLDTLVRLGDWPEGEPQSIGIGYAEQGENAAYYEIWEWPEAQAWRAALGLGPKDLHITLGVRGVDLQGVPKDRSTLIDPSNVGAA